MASNVASPIEALDAISRLLDFAEESAVQAKRQIEHLQVSLPKHQNRLAKLQQLLADSQKQLNLLSSVFPTDLPDRE